MAKSEIIFILLSCVGCIESQDFVFEYDGDQQKPYPQFQPQNSIQPHNFSFYPVWSGSNQQTINQKTNQNFNSLRKSVSKCEEYKALAKPKTHANTRQAGSQVFGGIKTEVSEFPHMAAIGFRENDEKISYRCGGSLISEKFVLTAAHCRSFVENRRQIFASVVRLGATLITFGQAKDLRIEKFIRHPNYNSVSYSNDIALIELNGAVNFNKNILPACLWQPELILPQDMKVIATGWGNTEKLGGKTSLDLMKVSLDLLNNSYCQDDDGESVITENQICAGVLQGDKDTCQGDSGGPIQTVVNMGENVYFILGVTSYGNIYCGGKNAPAVYTRVSNYLNWIESKVWPQ